MDDTPKDDKPNTGGFTRRDMAKIGAVTAAAVAVPTVLNNIGAQSMAATPKDRYDTDILIIGTGFAGVFAAVEARKNGHKVVMMDKGAVGWSGLSPWASDSRPFDPEIYSREEWHHNTATNTEWVNDRKWLDIFMDESIDIFWTLRGWGVHDCKPFERSKAFRDVLMDEDGVTLIERTLVTSFLKDTNGRVAGALGFTFDDSREPSKAVVVSAKAVIMCTGAGAYKSPGFPNWGQTFDGDAMAYEVGASISGKEFHDTHATFSDAPAASYEGWVWAQSVTGAYIMAGPPDPINGGLSLDGPINASTGSIYRGTDGGPAGGGPIPKGPNPERVRNKSRYEGRGFLKTDGLHIDWGGPPEGSAKDDFGFRVGGSTAGMGVHKGEGVFNSDYTCKADGVEGLYAAGDALASMLCGSSYPGRGFSSYGSAIQGRRASRYASEEIKGMDAPVLDSDYLAERVQHMWGPRENEKGFSPEWVTSVLQNTMTPLHILYIKEGRRLDGALASIEYLRKSLVPKMIAKDGHQLRMAHETASMLLNAEMKLRAGIYRTESRGTHYREDYPARNDAEWLCWVLMRKAGDGSMELSKHMIPEEWHPDPSTPYRERYPRVFPGEDDYRASLAKQA